MDKKIDLENLPEETKKKLADLDLARTLAAEFHECVRERKFCEAQLIVDGWPCSVSCDALKKVLKLINDEFEVALKEAGDDVEARGRAIGEYLGFDPEKSPASV